MAAETRNGLMNVAPAQLPVQPVKAIRSIQGPFETSTGSHSRRISRQTSDSSNSRHSISSRLPSAADPQFAITQLAHSTSTSTSTSEAEIEGNINIHAIAIANGSDDWAERGASRKVEHATVDGVKTSRVVKKGVKDFSFGRTLGEGSYSTVVAATDRQTLKEYAIKVLDKRHIIKEKKVKYVNIEKNTLFRLGNHPGVVRLFYTFQDERSLYFVLDLAANGELLGVLKKLTSFDEECTRYYGAQILDAVEYMHSCGVIHRDLKPENVLLDDKMRVKLADFGTAKLLDLPKTAQSSGNVTESEAETTPDAEHTEEYERANSFVGTAEYVSPELLTEKSTCKSSDLWAFGCILYQMISGRPPFKGSNEFQTFQKIINLDYAFPPGFPSVARDLIKRLLVLDPNQRPTIEAIKRHPFFEKVDWTTLWKLKAPKLKPYRPQRGGCGSTSNCHASHSSVTDASLSSAYSGMRIDTTEVQQTKAPIARRSESAEPRPQSRMQPTRSTSSNISPSELDLQWAQILMLPTERILRLGPVLVEGSDTASARWPKMLRRRKSRTLLVSSTGRCLFVEAHNGTKKIKSQVLLSGPGLTNIRANRENPEKMWSVETVARTYFFEDPGGRALEWIDVLNRANTLSVVAPMVGQESSSTRNGRKPGSESELDGMN